MRNFFFGKKGDAAESEYKLGEALLLSAQGMACKEHKGTWVCCVMKNEWVTLYTLSESGVNKVDYHTIGVWESDLKNYGLSLYGWFPAEKKLPASLLEKVRKVQ